MPQAEDSTDAPQEGHQLHINNLPSGILHAIFSHLGPKDLCRATATCGLWRELNRDAAANRAWRAFYAARWKLAHAPRPALLLGSSHAAAAADGAQHAYWQRAYGRKMLKLKSWSGKYHQDHFFGHRSACRSLKLLPAHNLVVTGSLDKTVRLWDLAAGMPLSVSRPHGGTVRAVAMDARAVISGCTDHLLRVWDARSEGDSAPAAAMFDLSVPADRLLRGHIGPVSSLCLTEAALYSGSWDYTVRAWRRGGGDDWECSSVLRYDDWVYSVAARGGHLLVSAGVEVLVHDLETGQLTRKFQNLHDGHVASVEGTQNGRMLFTGAVDGLVMAHDLRMRDPSCVLWHHKGGVSSLAFEDPWLVSGSSDGTVQLINTESAAVRDPASCVKNAAHVLTTNCRQLQGPGGPVFAVDIGDQWLACGAESDVVRTWDFTRAEEVAQRAAAAKAARNSRRSRRRRDARDVQLDQNCVGGSYGAAAVGVGVNGQYNDFRGYNGGVTYYGSPGSYTYAPQQQQQSFYGSPGASGASPPHVKRCSWPGSLAAAATAASRFGTAAPLAIPVARPAGSSSSSSQRQDAPLPRAAVLPNVSLSISAPAAVTSPVMATAAAEQQRRRRLQQAAKERTSNSTGGSNSASSSSTAANGVPPQERMRTWHVIRPNKAQGASDPSSSSSSG